MKYLAKNRYSSQLSCEPIIQLNTIVALVQSEYICNAYNHKLLSNKSHLALTFSSQLTICSLCILTIYVILVISCFGFEG